MLHRIQCFLEEKICVVLCLPGFTQTADFLIFLSVTAYFQPSLSQVFVYDVIVALHF